jgi:starch synthase (maltosyl-transferring)
MGFDIIYFPPIHPIGKLHRKGLNNSVTANPGDPGSPWAIGSDEGGHKAIHPQLGNMKDFTGLVKVAKEAGIEIALDLALQCAPDHPYVKEHPKWFKWRPDGTVQYAENPPKKYQDILPINFENEDWENLWQELKSIFDFWIDKGVKIFRVDNPHTKPFNFWEWLIREVRNVHPEIIFLAEAFTRPRIMEQLGKIGFNQSYTYFTWRTTSEEIISYMHELTKTERSNYYRPNFWPNTPDILPPHLVTGGEPAHILRVILAATLSSNYGLYGPVYEFGLNVPFPGKEEYIDSEKYEFKHWDWDSNTRTRDIIRMINHIRRENPALQETNNISFGSSENSQIICYGKTTDDYSNQMIMVVNLDPYNIQRTMVKLPLYELGIPYDRPFWVRDLISGSKYQWQGERNYVELNPHVLPAHVLRVEHSAY